MLLVEIDVVGLQPLQARLDRGHDVAARGALLGAVVAIGLEYFVASTMSLRRSPSTVAEHGLRAAHARIDVGGVEQRDAEVDRLVDHLARGFEIGALAEIVAAEADGGNAQAGAAEIANLHGSILWGAYERGRIVARAPCSPQGAAYRAAGARAEHAMPAALAAAQKDAAPVRRGD